MWLGSCEVQFDRSQCDWCDIDGAGYCAVEESGIV
jgi:hypothetical protein